MSQQYFYLGKSKFSIPCSDKLKTKINELIYILKSNIQHGFIELYAIYLVWFAELPD